MGPTAARTRSKISDVRRTALIVGLILSTFVPAAHGQVPSGDSVVGQGRTAPFGDLLLVNVFDIEARSGPSGEDPSGHVSVGIGLLAVSPSLLHIEGPVTCLSVSGNDAVVGFAPDPVSIFPAVLIEVEDNGPPGSDPPDLVRVSGRVGDPSSCASPGIERSPVAEGDVTVIDAPPPPTSKSQCKDGGYERFGFKNQGECIKFVQAGPKP
jgi:hypothetical protein